MLKQLKKKSFLRSLFFSIILLIAGTALALFHLQNAFYSAFGYDNFGDLAPEEIRSQLVDVELWENYGCFMESGTQNTSTRKVSIDNYYYIIYTGNMDDEGIDYKYMAIRVPAKYGDQMDIMAENTWNYMITSPLTFSGKIKKMDSDEMRYFKEYWQDAELTDEEIEEMTLPYYIESVEYKTAQRVLYLALFGAGILMILWSIFRTVKAAGGGYLRKLYQDMAQIGCSEKDFDEDFRTAASFAKKDMIKIGRLFTYYNVNTTVPRAIPNTKIIWAYQTTTTHRTNGIKTGTTYGVAVYTTISKAAINIPVESEAKAQLILHRLSSCFPWIVVGYSDDLANLFKRDSAGFLNLRYNTVDHVLPDYMPPDNDPYGAQQETVTK